MIYFIQIDSGDIKIGKAVHLTKRLYQHWLEGGYGRNLVVIGVKEGGREEEKRIHSMFAHLRRNTRNARTAGPVEVFQPSKELLGFIANHCRKPDLLDILHEKTGRKDGGYQVSVAPFAISDRQGHRRTAGSQKKP